MSISLSFSLSLSLSLSPFLASPILHSRWLPHKIESCVQTFLWYYSFKDNHKKDLNHDLAWDRLRRRQLPEAEFANLSPNAFCKEGLLTMVVCIHYFC